MEIISVYSTVAEFFEPSLGMSRRNLVDVGIEYATDLALCLGQSQS
jgi:hypothetical protein